MNESPSPEKDSEKPASPPPPKPEKDDNGVFSFAKKNLRDTIAYILLLLGIIWLFFNPFYGGLLIGAVNGFYFSDEILNFIKMLKEDIDNYGTAKSLLLAGTLLAFFISAPGIFIGAALFIVLKEVLASSNKK